MNMTFRVMICMVLGLSVVGCSTNRIADSKKSEYIEELSVQGEHIMERIDTIQSEKEQQERALKAQLLKIQERLKEQYGKKNMYLTKAQGGLQVTILDSVLFNSGSSKVNSGGNTVLTEVATLLGKTNKDIQITGHTDNAPIQKSKNKFKSNWDLSLQRALSVLHIFEKSGVKPGKMYVVGYGEFKPVVSNNDKKGRAENRRVEILILDQSPKRVRMDKKTVVKSETNNRSRYIK